MGKRKIDRKHYKIGAKFIEVKREEANIPFPPFADQIYRNNKYIVFISNAIETTHGIARRALIQKLDNTPIRLHWREMQKIKNQIFGSEVTAVEYYPAESKLIDDHNIYWLWVFEEGVLPLYN